MVNTRGLARMLIAALVAAAPAAEAVQLSLPEVTAAPGEKIRVPVRIDGMAGEQIYSGNLDIRFAIDLVEIGATRVERSGTLSSTGWAVAINPRALAAAPEETAQVRLGAATGNMPVAADGIFFYLELQIAADAPVGASTPLRLESASLNNGTPAPAIQHGLLTIVGPRIKADFTANPLEGIAPLEVTFTDQSTEGVETYLWEFGDGTTSEDADPTHVYEEAGQYTVSLTVAGGGSADTETKENYILVTPDERPPEIIEGPVALGTTHSATAIYWTTDELSDSQVQYCGLKLRPTRGSLEELIETLEGDLVDHGQLPGCGDDGGDEGDGNGGLHKPTATPGRDSGARRVGALRLENFGSGSGGEIYLGNGDLSDRVEQDFHQSSPCAASDVVDGAWQPANHILLSYDPGTGILRTQVQASHTYCREYQLGDAGELDYMQFDVVNRANGATVKLKNAVLNGWQLGTFTSAGWETWKAAGYDFSSGFTLEGELELQGEQPDGQTNKVQISFGKGSDGGDDDGDGCGDLVQRWLLRGALPHFDDNAAALFPLIAHCGQVIEDELTLDHEIPLQGLTPFTFYIYRVRSADDDGNPSDWKGGFFVTQARPDDLPPRIILGPQATPAADRALIEWDTDEPGDSFVQYGADENFADDSRVRVDELAYHHEVWLENLAENTIYYYRVRSTDASGNASTLKRGHFRTTGTDVTPPVIWNGPRVTLRTPFKALIEWKTDEPGNSRVEFGTDENYGRFVASEKLVQHHQVLLTHLDSQTLYHYRVVSTDINGNTAASQDETFVTRGREDLQPPGIVKQPYVITRFHDRVTLGWSMDEVCQGRVEFGTTPGFGQTVEIPEFAREHTAVLSGLAPGTRYYGRVHMFDLEGNGPTASREFEFRTASRRDSQAPIIEGQPVISERTDTQVTIAWNTDEASDSAVEFGATAEYGEAASSAALVREHAVRLTGLEPGTTYHFRVSSTDAAGNGPAFSDDFTFSTRSTADGEAPIILAGPAVVAVSEEAAVVEWTTSEPTDGLVDYGTDLAYGLEAFSERFDRTHRVHLVQLTPKTTYHFRVSSTDAAGNGPTSSRDLTFETRKKADRKAPKIWAVSAHKVTDSAALIEWKTDEPATSIVDYGTDADLGERLEDPELGRWHQVRLSGLEPGTTYQFRAISADISGNQADSRIYSFRTDSEPDQTAPVVIEGPEVVVSHAAATFIWRTSEPCFAAVVAGTESTMGTSEELIFESLQAADEHRITLTGLRRGTRYLFALISRDLEGNETVIGDRGRRSGKIVRPLGDALSFTTAAEADFTAPAIVAGPSLAAITDTEALIFWTTDEIGDSRVFLEEDGQLSPAVSIAAHDFEHQALLTGLTPGATYRVRVASADPAGNGPTQSPPFAFTTRSRADTSPPQLTAPAAVIEVGDQLATIAWETDEASSSEVRFGADGLDRTVSDPTLVTRHRVTLIDLAPGTTYRFQAFSYDVEENGPAQSDLLTFTTASAPDVRAPNIVSGPSVARVAERSAELIWETDEAADSFARFGAVELDQEVGRAELNTRHRVLLSGLQPGTTYRFQATSADRAGNGPAQSQVLTLTTPTEADRVPPPAPAGLSAQATGSGQALIGWDPVEADDLAGYNVYRALGKADFALLAGPLTATAYRDQGLAASGAYQYRVSAVDRAGNEGAVSEVAAIDVKARRPGDFQGDGRVSFEDFFLLAENLGRRSGDAGFSDEFDLDGDERISLDDFFRFVALFGTDYAAGRPVAGQGAFQVEPDLRLGPGARAGQVILEVRLRGSGALRGYGASFEYDPQSVDFRGAELADGGRAGALAGLLADRPGALSVGGYGAAEDAAADRALARLRFQLRPGAGPPSVRLVELAVVDGNGRSGSIPLSAESGQIRLTPLTYVLEQNAPNPFNPQTEIRFLLPQSGPVSLRVYDLLGQEVAALVDAALPAGYHRVVWDGRDAKGRDAASGVYFYTMETRGFRQTRKLLLLR